MLKLFTAPGTVGLACEIALEESGADYKVVRLNFAENEQRKAEYLAVNPKSRVPALVCEQGVISETPAILGYIAESFPRAGLAPVGDAFAYAQMQAFNSYLCSWIHPAAAHRFRGYRWADDPVALKDMARKAPEVFAAAMALIEAEYLAGPCVLGEAFSTSDIYLYVVTSWLPRDGIDMAQFPRVADHFARMGERKAVRDVLARVG